MPASLKRHLCCSKAGDSSYGAGSAGISCQTDYVRNGQHTIGELSVSGTYGNPVPATEEKER